jgi:hypothetical protein
MKGAGYSADQFWKIVKDFGPTFAGAERIHVRVEPIWTDEDSEYKRWVTALDSEGKKPSDIAAQQAKKYEDSMKRYERGKGERKEHALAILPALQEMADRGVTLSMTQLQKAMEPFEGYEVKADRYGIEITYPNKSRDSARHQDSRDETIRQLVQEVWETAGKPEKEAVEEKEFVSAPSPAGLELEPQGWDRITTLDFQVAEEDIDKAEEEEEERPFTFGDWYQASDGTIGIRRGHSSSGKSTLVDEKGEGLGFFFNTDLKPLRKKGSIVRSRLADDFASYVAREVKQLEQENKHRLAQAALYERFKRGVREGKLSEEKFKKMQRDASLPTDEQYQKALRVRAEIDKVRNTPIHQEIDRDRRVIAEMLPKSLVLRHISKEAYRPSLLSEVVRGALQETNAPDLPPNVMRLVEEHIKSILLKELEEGRLGEIRHAGAPRNPKTYQPLVHSSVYHVDPEREEKSKKAVAVEPSLGVVEETVEPVSLFAKAKNWNALSTTERNEIADAFLDLPSGYHGPRLTALEEIGPTLTDPTRSAFMRYVKDRKLERETQKEVEQGAALPTGKEILDTNYYYKHHLYARIEEIARTRGIDPSEFENDKPLKDTLEQLALSGRIGKRADGGYGPPPEESPLLARASEIPRSKAIQAYNNTSTSPERRGWGAQSEYAKTFNQWAEPWLREARLSPDRQEIEDIIAETKKEYHSAFMAYLYAQSRTISTNIVGPGGVNVQRERKKHDTADRRLAEASEVLEKGTKRIEGLIKRRKDEREAERLGLDPEAMGRQKLRAVGQLSEAQRREQTAIRSGGDSRTAREKARRAADLEAKASMTGEVEIQFPARPNHDFKYVGTFDMPSGEVIVDFDSDAIRITFDDRLGKEAWRKVVKGHGFKYSRRFDSAYRSNITGSAVRDVKIITGVDLFDEIPGLNERFEEAKRREEEAAKQVQEARKARKQAAREGEGTLADVVNAAMRKRAQFKLPAPADSEKAGKKISPSVRKVGGATLAYMFTYNTGEKARFLSAMRPGKREMIVGMKQREDGQYYAVPYTNMYTPDFDWDRALPIPLNDNDTNAEKATAIVATYRDVLLSFGSLDNLSLRARNPADPIDIHEPEHSTLSTRTLGDLRRMRDRHNKRIRRHFDNDPTKKVDMDQLKEAYRRGGNVRVHAFLDMLERGYPVRERYAEDLHLVICRE